MERLIVTNRAIRLQEQTAVEGMVQSTCADKHNLWAVHVRVLSCCPLRTLQGSTRCNDGICVSVNPLAPDFF